MSGVMFRLAKYNTRLLAKTLRRGNEVQNIVMRGGSIRCFADKVSWQAANDADIQRVTQNAIIHELTREQTRTIESVVPWFLNTMPSAYFRQVSLDTRMDHMKAISAVKDANMDLHLNLQTHLPNGGQMFTFIRPGKQVGRLLDLIHHLPWDHNEDGYLPLSRVKVFTADDESLSISMFIYGAEDAGGYDSSGYDLDLEEAGRKVFDYALRVQRGDFEGDADRKLLLSRDSPYLERDHLENYLKKCSEPYITKTHPRRFLNQMQLFSRVSGTDGTAVEIERSSSSAETSYAASYYNEGQYWVDIAVANSLPQVALEHITTLIYHHGFDVVRSHLDLVNDDDNGSVCFIRMLVEPMAGGNNNNTDDDSQKSILEKLKKEIIRIKWLDPSTIDLFVNRYPWLTMDRAEIITAFCSLMHPVMAKTNSFIFSKANILDLVTKERTITHAAAIADLFRERFNPDGPPLSDADLETKSRSLRKQIDDHVEDSNTHALLNKMIDIVLHTLRTNVFMENRYALGLRLDPRIMHPEYDDDKDGSSSIAGALPFGMIFAHGRRFNAHHVRFRDISRGGMRLVTPPNPEQFALESARQYDECYGLAFAQQLKNKDIPEGGAKAVNLIDVSGLSAAGKDYAMRKSVKAFTDTILDLIVETEETKEKVVDFYGAKELIYLGPDEQVIPKDIEWVVKRAAKRGYAVPNAFMSSKPRSGINHKEYGVTSEGVNVYLDVALREALHIDPTKDSFTVKMTGGPDGDVGGNEIKILIREYGENVKIVGIADHSGCAEDPAGLDHEELMRLVKKNHSIDQFNPEALSSEGVLHKVDTEEGIHMRNTMHNRLIADAFIPAGGRPNTINSQNYKQFLRPDGTPSSPLIVEGANLFITEDARQSLFDEGGVIIVKDSSANKAGVITSSYEICAAMLLTEDEFFTHKDAIVTDVLSKLRELAHVEATLLFREFKKYPGSLPHVSKVISNAINIVTDAIAEALDDDDKITKEDLEQLMPLFRAHLPPTLASLSFDHVVERVPMQYIKNAIASCLASKMVYKEGTKFIETLPKDRIAAMALDYIAKEKEVALLIEGLEGVEGLDEQQKKRVLELLKEGGTRTALNLL